MNKHSLPSAFESSMNNSRLASHWVSSAGIKVIFETVGTPVFVYSETQFLKNIQRVKSAATSAGLIDRVSLYVPFFPNSNPHILQPLLQEGLGVLIQTPNEYEILTRHGFTDFIVSPGHISDHEIAFWNQKGYPTFLSSLDEIQFALERSTDAISVRIDSLGCDKPGVKIDQLGELANMIDHYGRTLECFEVYCGSGNSLADMIDIVQKVFQIYLDHFPTARSINFAGGHGFNYEQWDEENKHFDWETYFQKINELANEMGIPKTVLFLFEPARDILADIGVMITEVKRNIISHSSGSIVVTNGTRMLMPSAQLRNRPHNTVFLDENLHEIPLDSASTLCKIRGRTILRNDYILPGEVDVPDAVKQGNYLIIMDVGAYCATQHMEFLNAPPAGEVLIDAAGTPYLVSIPGSDLDKWRNLLHQRQLLATQQTTE